jgi:tetratricopeptide (TPR) repeat protein
LGEGDEAIHCYRQALELDPEAVETHYNLGVTLAEQGKLDEAIASYREALRQWPDFDRARQLLNVALAQQGTAKEVAGTPRKVALPASAEEHKRLGLGLARVGKREEALVHFREALRFAPDDAEAHFQMGDVFRHLDRYAEAEGCYLRSLQLRPERGDVCNHLGITLLRQGRPGDAEVRFREAVCLTPNSAEPHNNLGVALEQLGRVDEASLAFQESIRLNPEAADTHKNLALVMLLRGEFERGWAEYEWRLRVKNPALRSLPQPRWDGSPLEGRSILLRAEQGLGDSLQFIRYAPLVQARGGTVFFECPPRLIPLLRRCPGIAQLIPQGTPLPDFAVQAPLFSLPALFGTTVATIPASVPYLTADPVLVKQWRDKIHRVPGFRVGISWQGSPTYLGDRHRSIPLRHYAPLARLPGVRLISLQKGAGLEQLAEVKGRWQVMEFGEERDEQAGAFMDTAAVLQHLDLVISSDTSLVHLAGALGIPVWVAIPMARDWRWLLNREDCPWYPTMRLFRQRRWGDWDEVFERIASALQERRDNARFQKPLVVDLAPAELIDKITILEIKRGRLSDPEKLKHVWLELGSLLVARARSLRSSGELDALTAKLKDVNERLWEIEDAIRICEQQKDFGARFIELARSVYQENDQRAAIKRTINDLLGSPLVEEKSYPAYKEEAAGR